MTGSTVGNYKLVEKLGEGGMGAVYRGVDVMVERDVAIKMLRPEIARQPEIVERFRAEAVALARLNHPNIATLYSFFREGDEYFMVMEFVLGRTLESIIRDFPVMRSEQAIAISSQVLDAVEHAHSYGILHRDIKPANIMLTGAGQVKVTDFGIARVLGKARTTQAGCIYGTLEYLAPERVRGQEADIRSDLYSMGVVLYEMLSGRLPFERDNSYDLMRAHLEETPPSFASFGLTSVPSELEKVVAKALAKLPEERFATAGEFRTSLASCERKESIQSTWLAAEPSDFAEPAPQAVEAPAAVTDASPSAALAVSTARRRWKPYAIAAVLLVLIGLMLALFWSRKPAAVEATTPAPAPVVAPPSTPVVQPQAGDQLGTAPALPQSQQGADTQDLLESAPPAQAEAAAPTRNTVKAKSPVKSAPELDRRKAALEALGKDATAAPTATKKTEKDRRSSSLDALKK